MAWPTESIVAEEFTMTLKDLFLSQPDREGATTRKAVERVPGALLSLNPTTTC